MADFDWNGLVEDVTKFGEPGILNLPLVWKTDPEAEGFNPCVTGDTRVATHFGMLRIVDLVSGGQGLRVTTDGRVQGGYSVDSVPESFGGRSGCYRCVPNQPVAGCFMASEQPKVTTSKPLNTTSFRLKTAS